jgi:branched-chain amino acid transport system permease protein
VGAAILTALPESLRFLKEYRGIVNGLIIVLVILYLPRGLVNPDWFRRKRKGAGHAQA